MVAIKIEFVSSKFQAFSSYNLICGENCVLCRLSATVCFLSGMIALFMGNSLNFSTVLSFIFFLFLFLIKKKKCASLVAFLHKQESTNINLRWKGKQKYIFFKSSEMLYGIYFSSQTIGILKEICYNIRYRYKFQKTNNLFVNRKNGDRQ